MNKKNIYRWNNYVPMTGSEALRAFRKGMEILVIRPGRKPVPMATEADIRRFARKRCIFAADRVLLLRKEATFKVDYFVVIPGTEGEAELLHPEGSPHFHKEYSDRYEIFENCKANLTELIQRHQLPDGKYWTEFLVDEDVLGKVSNCDYDEGEITVVNGQVTEVPSGFVMPF